MEDYESVGRLSETKVTLLTEEYYVKKQSLEFALEIYCLSKHTVPRTEEHIIKLAKIIEEYLTGK